MVSNGSEAEQENERVREFVTKPSFQFEYRHALRTVYTLKDLPKEAKDQKNVVLNKFGQEASFLSIFSFFYDFYRFVRKSEMHRRKKWYNKQVKELGYLILLELFHPEKATPTEAEEKPNQPQNISARESEEWVPIKNFNRIRSNNPELFFSAPKPPSAYRKGRERRRDKRVSHFSTVFSELPKVEELDKETAWLLQMALTVAAESTMSPEEIEQRKELMAGLRMVDPDDIFGLESFWEIAKHSLETMTAKYGQPSQNAWLLRHIKKRSIVLESIYQLVDKAVALRWYRTMKSERRKSEFFKEKHPLHFLREDAKRAVEANLSWFGDNSQVVDLVFRGAKAYSQIRKLDVAVTLYKECLNQLSWMTKIWACVITI